MKYLLISNPLSGSSAQRRNDAERFLRRFKEMGHEVSLCYTERAGHATEIARESIGRYDVICAVGGDGTVNEVGQSLRGTEQTMGIIPRGSGNGLARELEIPLSPEDAIECLLQDRRATIDTCVANGDPFFCTCGMGFDGSVSTEFAKSTSRGPMTYVKDSVQTFFNHTPELYTLTVDGEQSRHRAFLIAAANASQYGNNAFIAPGASITDRMLDVTVIREFPALEAAQVAIQLFSKGLGKNPYTRLYRGHKILIEAKAPTPYHLDGDPKPPTDRLEIEVSPRELHIVTGDMSSIKGKSVIDFFNQITNNYFEWRDELIGNVRDTFKIEKDNK